jgi:23S rRNA pseudouridine2605 synthase
MHPSQGVEKEYEVVVDKPLDPEVHFPKLVKGMMTPEGFAKAERVWAENSHYRFHLVLKQGLKRQIRHMLYFLGFEVERLIRVRIGWLAIKGLTKGGYKELTETEVARFFSETKPVSAAPKKARANSEKSSPKAPKEPSHDAFDSEDARPTTRSRPREDGRKRTAASTSRSKREASPKDKSKFDSPAKSPRSRSKRPGQSEGYGKDRPQAPRKPSSTGKSSPSGSRSPARKKPSPGGKRPPGRGKR